ncbi:MAG TPA: SMP-30/gluconolactonase/LRE family protein [Candidatus Binatia bacterium]|nr:SMP-30/gluconolactonase/LRE family protein [Candidatus Binatia bacterium]
MIKIFLAAAVALLSAAAYAAAQKIPEKAVVAIDPSLDALVSPDAKLELVKGGFGFTEGALWVQQGKSGYLLFSDIPANVIYRWTPDGKVSVHLDHSGYAGRDIWRVGFIQTNGKEKSDPLYEEFPMIGSNGLALDRQGRLVIATWAGRSIDRIEKNGKRTVLADRYEGKRFGGTNDLVVKKDGAIYFTDGYGGLRQRENDPKKELDFAGIFMLRDGKVTRIIYDIARPNGLAFSPDEKYLYANGGRDKFIKRYEVQADGTVANGRMFIDISPDQTPGITDGMRIDSKGNVYETAAGGVWVISPEGKHLGTILTPELAANVEFGDPDRKTLYIAARTSIYKIRVNTPGLP